MKKIGLIGGLGPEATVDYYEKIIDCFKGEGENLNYPEIVIYNVNMAHFIGLLKKKENGKAAQYITEKVNALAIAGADFGAITANTPHLLFDAIQKNTSLPLISIVEATGREAKKRGIKKAGLIGTLFTMNNPFFADVFHRDSMEVATPNEEEKKLINHKLFSEIELGIFTDETRKELTDIIDRMVKDDKIDAIILGCTELPLILKEHTYSGIPVLDTTAIHVAEIVNVCKSQ